MTTWSRWKSKLNGDKCILVRTVWDSTRRKDVVIYEDHDGTWWAKDKDDFEHKFELIGPFEKK